MSAIYFLPRHEYALHFILLEKIFIVHLLNGCGNLCRLLTKAEPLFPADKAFMFWIYLGEYMGDSGGGAEVSCVHEGCRVNQMENLGNIRSQSTLSKRNFTEKTTSSISSRVMYPSPFRS